LRIQVTRTEPVREGDWNVSPYNFDPKVREGMNLPPQVEIVDLTLREGRQVAGMALTLDEVLEYARRARAAGLRTLEMHHSEPEEIRRVKELDLDIAVQSLVHPTASLNPETCRREIDESIQVGADIISLSAYFSDYNFSLLQELGGVDFTREAAVDAICEAVEYGKQQGATISVLIADHTRIDVDKLRKFSGQFVSAGADIIRLDDICAPCSPGVYRYLASEVKAVIGNARLAIHSHNDFDLAVASQLASLEGGADILEGSVNGMGERAGIPSISSLVANLEVLYGYDTGVEMAAMQELSDYVADTWGIPVPDRFAVVGRNAFSHSVGVHYVENEWAFNAWMPHVVGNSSYVPMGMFSGPKASRKRARDLGLGELNDEQAGRVNRLVRDDLKEHQVELSDERFAELVTRVLAGHR
jgi:isopropylmalate/homocitrate/citramalate synthase